MCSHQCGYLLSTCCATTIPSSLWAQARFHYSRSGPPCRLHFMREHISPKLPLTIELRPSGILIHKGPPSLGTPTGQAGKSRCLPGKGVLGLSMGGACSAWEGLCNNWCKRQLLLELLDVRYEALYANRNTCCFHEAALRPA